MKKVIVFTASLLSCLSLSAKSGDSEALTLAILNNNYLQVGSRLDTKYSQEALKGALETAKEKNKFYHQRLKRWDKGLTAAILGAPLGVILAAVGGGLGTLKTIEYMEEKNIVRGGDPVGGILLSGIGGVGGVTLGIGATTTLVVWVDKKVKKWKYLADESDLIVSLISFQLGIKLETPFNENVYRIFLKRGFIKQR